MLRKDQRQNIPPHPPVGGWLPPKPPSRTPDTSQRVQVPTPAEHPRHPPHWPEEAALPSEKVEPPGWLFLSLIFCRKLPTRDGNLEEKRAGSAISESIITEWICCFAHYNCKFDICLVASWYFLSTWTSLCSVTIICWRQLDNNIK